MKKSALIIVLFIIPFILQAQDIKPKDDNSSKITGADTNISTPYFSLSAGWMFPFGEMGRRYSSFLSLEGNLGWKTKENWLFILGFNFQFGSNNIKQLDDILSTLMTDDKNNFIIGQDGTDAGVVGYNRNLSLHFGLGKIFPLSFSNPNSGIAVMIHGGYIQHQIIYQATEGTVPQLEGDYAYGYDRQMRGPVGSVFVGYMHLSKKSYANWYAGTQFYVARTKMTRQYQFDLQSGDNNRYTDYMLTVKVGWMIPFFGRSADKIYFY